MEAGRDGARGSPRQHVAYECAPQRAQIDYLQVTAVLAVASLYVHPRIPFHTPRNLLAPLWTGPEPSPLYPPLVWQYLSRPEFSNDRQRSIREHLVERWRHETGLDHDALLAALLFGGGGDYDVEALRKRAELLAEVAAEVQLASQDLASLAAVLFAEAR